MKRLLKVEKILIATTDTTKYITYRCAEHGVFQQRNDIKNGLCPYCHEEYKPVDNIDQLKEKYREELGL